MNKLIIIVSVIAILIIVITISWSYYNVEGHKEYCDKWSADLNNTHSQITNQLFPDESLVNQYNSDLMSYNKQCVY